MSLKQTVTKAVDEIIFEFISQVATKYNLDPNELITMWDGEAENVQALPKSVPKKASSVTQIPSNDEELNPKELLTLKKPELQALCRKRGLKCTGTKPELIALLAGGSSGVEEEKPKTAPIKEVSVKKPATTTPVVKKLVANALTVSIRRNQFGNHEHPETALVFDPKTKKVIGKQNDNGSVDDLTPEDIDVCNQYKFDYSVPENLDKKSKLEEEKVEELDEDEDEEPLESDDEEDLDEVDLIENDDVDDLDEEIEDFE